MLLDQLEKYCVDITCIQEMRWTGSGTIEKKNWIIFYSCDNKQHKLGTGFIIHKKVKHLILNFQPKSPRMCWLRIKGKFFNYSIINAHAPTEDKSDIEKDAFYDELRNLYDACPKHDVKLIIGDLNAQIGKETIYYPTIGKEAFHQESNGNGKRLIHFAASRNMVIGTTLFQHKDIHKITWRSPDAHHFSQIDHLLIDSRHAPHLMDVRSHRCANVDSDHFLIVSRMRARISNAKKFFGRKVERYDQEKMTLLKKQTEYRTNLTEHLQELTINSDDSLDSRWNKITCTIHKTAEEIFGKISRKQPNDWFDKECQETTGVKNAAYVTMQQRSYTRASVDKYREARRKEKQVHKRKKKQYENNQIEKLEELGQHHQIRQFYRDINTLRKDFKPRLTICKSKNGDIITEKDGILNRWNEHFHELLDSREKETEPPIMQDHNDTNEEDPPPTTEEVEMAVQKLKKHKAPGIDNIPAELFKYGGSELVKQLHTIIKDIWLKEKMPTDWNLSIICPIHKKGDIMECSNYRGVTLLNTAYKILSNILFARISPFTENIIGNYQCGFRKNRSTTNQIFTLRQIMEKTKEFGIETHHLFIDFKSAYDTVRREQLYNAMSEFNIPNKLIRLTRMTMEHTISNV